MSDSFPTTICSNTLRKFLQEIQNAYDDTRQRVSQHAKVIVRASEEIFRKSHWNFSVDSRLAHLALLTAAFCHKVGHVETSKDSTVSRSIQRQVDLAMQTLGRHFFLVNLNQRDKRVFKALVTQLLLNTDMSLHGRLINQSKTLWDKKYEAAKSLHKDILALTVMLKAAHVWHTTFEWKAHLEWSDKISQETTGKRHENLNEQIWFMRTVAIPMVHTVCRLAQLEQALRNCYLNLDGWCTKCEQESRQVCSPAT